MDNFFGILNFGDSGASFLDFDLPDSIRNFIKEYVDIPKSFDTILKNKLESFYEDLGWGKLTLNTYVQQFFKF